MADASTNGLDTSDVDRYVGKALPTVQLSDPVAVGDIRRWVQGMQYANPIHYDEEQAARSAFGRIVAPQSFMVCCDVGHGATPAIVGNIPGTHMIFGGDEWWFFGPRVFPGDHLRMRRWFVDYKVADTKFAGPTMFSRGDTLYRNQRGEPVAKQRSTAVRYLAEEARKRGFFGQAAPEPTWTAGRLEELVPSGRTPSPRSPPSGGPSPSRCGERRTTRAPSTSRRRGGWGRCHETWRPLRTIPRSPTASTRAPPGVTPTTSTHS